MNKTVTNVLWVQKVANINFDVMNGVKKQGHDYQMKCKNKVRNRLNLK